MKNRIVYLLLFLLFGQSSAFSQLHDDLSLKYLVRQPQANTKSMPVIILLHGYGSNEADLFELEKGFPADFLVVSARAPQAIGKDAYQWYALSQAGGQAKEADLVAGRELIVRFVREIVARYHADPKQVYLSGFSQGAIMSYEAGLMYSGLFKGIAPLSGRIYPSLKASVHPTPALKQLRIFVGHGDKDQRIPYSDATAAVSYLQSIGLSPVFKTYPGMGHSISAAEMQDLVQWLQQP
jgi:phospholipase/carboxylesterase